MAADLPHLNPKVLLGNPGAAVAAPQEILLGSGVAFAGNTLAVTGSGGGTVTSVAGAGLLTGTVTTTGSISIANGTANTLVGYNSSGVAAGVTIGTNLTLSGGTLSASGGGGSSGTVSPASPGQVAVYSGTTTVGGVNQSTLQVLASNIIGGPIPTTTLGSGTASTTTFLRGDQAYAVPFTLTTTGSSGAATFSGGTLNIPSYSGGGTPGGSSGQIQINSSGSFGGVSVITAAQVPTTGLTITQFATTIVNVTQTTGTVTFDLSQSNKQTVTLTQNATAALSNPTTGQTFTLYFIQAASGGPFTLSFFSGITWIGTAGAPTMPTTAGAILEVIFECMGTG